MFCISFLNTTKNYARKLRYARYKQKLIRESADREPNKYVTVLFSIFKRFLQRRDLYEKKSAAVIKRRKFDWLAEFNVFPSE